MFIKSIDAVLTQTHYPYHGPFVRGAYASNTNRFPPKGARDVGIYRFGFMLDWTSF